VERAHREGIRVAEREEVRRQPDASDCARMRELTLILNAKEKERLNTKDGTTLGSAVAGAWTALHGKSWGSGVFGGVDQVTPRHSVFPNAAYLHAMLALICNWTMHLALEYRLPYITL
jgi:hypothetical protein